MNINNSTKSLFFFLYKKGIYYYLFLLKIKANSHYIRQVTITYRRGTRVVKNLKFLTPFFVLTTTINIILSMNCSYVILPYNTNNFTANYP